LTRGRDLQQGFRIWFGLCWSWRYKFRRLWSAALLALAPHDLYPFYSLCGRLYPALGPQFDQELGGFVVFFPGAMMSAIAGLILFRWLWNAELGLFVPVSAPVGLSVGTVLVPPLKETHDVLTVTALPGSALATAQADLNK
jgi:hypothetical protein